MYYYFLHPGGVWRCIYTSNKYPVPSNTLALCANSLGYPNGLKHCGSNMLTCNDETVVTAEVYTDQPGFSMLNDLHQ